MANKMTDNKTAAELSLLGGPLHRLGIRLGLVRDGNTVRLGLSIGLFLWVVLVLLALISNTGGPLFSMPLLGTHVRLLLVIPLMFISETVVDPRMTAFANGLVRRGIVREHQLAELDLMVRRITRLKDSWFLGTICVAVALFISFGATWVDSTGTSADFIPAKAKGAGVWAAWWYWAVCLTVFRFLLLRALSRLILWAYFLWRVSRLDLKLIPIHPDCSGGLGQLVTVQMQFLPLITGLALLRSSQFAEEISAGTMTFDETYPGIAVVILLGLAIVAGPLLVFTPKLWKTRLQGLADYMALAEDYVGQFDRKWVRTIPHSEPILGTPDIQSLADLSNSVQIVLRMRLSPVNARMLASVIGAVVIPMLPLLLFEFPLTEIAKKLVTGLVGL
jgi:hypothetical protein